MYVDPALQAEEEQAEALSVPLLSTTIVSILLYDGSGSSVCFKLKQSSPWEQDDHLLFSLTYNLSIL